MAAKRLFRVTAFLSETGTNSGCSSVSLSLSFGLSVSPSVSLSFGLSEQRQVVTVCSTNMCMPGLSFSFNNFLAILYRKALSNMWFVLSSYRLKPRILVSHWLICLVPGLSLVEPKFKRSGCRVNCKLFVFSLTSEEGGEEQHYQWNRDGEQVAAIRIRIRKIAKTNSDLNLELWDNLF